MAGRQRRPSPTRPAPAWPTTRSSTPTCPTSSATTSARSRSSPTCPTFRCTTDERAHVLANLDELVVKPANESGGYGLFIGPGRPRRSWRRPARRDRGRSPQLGGPADRRALDRADAVDGGRSCPATSTCGPFILTGRDQLRHPGRAHPGRPARGLARREQLPGRRQQGHLDRRDRATARAADGRRCCCRAWPRTSTGPAATWSGPRPRPGWSPSTPSCSSTCPCRCPLTWEPLLAVTGDGEASTRATDRPTRRSSSRSSLGDPTHPRSVSAAVGRPARTSARTREVAPPRGLGVVNELDRTWSATTADGVRGAAAAASWTR